MTILDTLRIVPTRDTVTLIVEQKAAGFPYLPIISTIIGGVAVWIAWRATRQWRRQYLMQEWSKTIALVLQHAKFYDSAKNQEYDSNYSDEDALKYELVARSSLAYIDDVVKLKMKNDLKTWMSGSVRVFAYPHLTWLRNNTESYSEEFLKALDEVIPDWRKTKPGSLSESRGTATGISREKTQ